jgi:hypothetical protein
MWRMTKWLRSTDQVGAPVNMAMTMRVDGGTRFCLGGGFLAGKEVVALLEEWRQSRVTGEGAVAFKKKRRTARWSRWRHGARGGRRCLIWREASMCKGEE